MATEVHTYTESALADRIPHFEQYVLRSGLAPLSRHPGWLLALQHGMGHVPYCLEAHEGTTILELLPLAKFRRLLFFLKTVYRMRHCCR
jgi:hypothetical protein